MTIPFEQISRATLAQAERLLPTWFPHGRRVGREFKIGNLRGDKGESLSINLDTGLWADFATGQKGGDLIDLRAAILGRPIADVANELAISLGVSNGNGNGNGHSPKVPSWEPIIPPTASAGRPDAMLAQFDVVYEYTDASDHVTHYVGRIEAKDGRRKQFVPITFGILNGVSGWHKKSPNAPRPLYGLNRLASMANAPVIICEGEKAADAAQRMFLDYACVAWPNGSDAVDRADFSPLKGRRAIIWPDNDEAGHKAAEAVRAKLPHATCLKVNDLPPGYDAADVSVDDPDDWIAQRLHKPASHNALPIVFFEDIQPNLDAADFVEGVLIEGSMAVVYGESNCGKTFFMTDLGLHVAMGKPWRGREIEQGGVIYCALEGSHGISNRVAAFRKHHGLDGQRLPFAIVPYSLNMLGEDVGRLIEAIQAAAEPFGCPIKLVVIDTLSRALAGGNENAPDAMGALVTSTDLVRQATNACVTYIHHSGKDAAKGARGHSLLRAATDTEIEVAREDKDAPSVARTMKQREMEIEGEFWFKLETVELGTNRRGKAVTSCVVTEAEPNSAPGQERTKLPDNAALAMRALVGALSKAGAKLPPTADYPRDTVAVSAGTWREEFYQLKSGSKETQIRAFSRAEDTLLSRNIITQRNGLVWLVKQQKAV